MWAMTNRHKGIAKALLDHGASPEVKSSSGRHSISLPLIVRSRAIYMIADITLEALV